MGLEEHIYSLNRRIAALGPARAAAFYACCAERFLPLYSAFSAAERWGNPDDVRRLLDGAWSACTRTSQEYPAASLAEIARNAPHSDDFDSVETTFAQDVCALISASLRAACSQEEDKTPPIDAVFEILRVAACVESTGFLDLGDDERAADFEAAFMHSDLFERESRFLEQDLETLSSESEIDSGLTDRIRQRAEENRYSVGELLPTQAAGDQ